MEVFTPDARVLGSGFALSVILGAILHKTHFCTMGAISDWVNFGDTTRLRSWLLAIAVAMLGVLILEAAGFVDFSITRPSYRTPQFSWLPQLFGGLMFGVGMTLASGCTSKNLVRLGAGNLKSLFVLIVIGFCAYLMTHTPFYALIFQSWMQPLSIDLQRYGLVGQDIGALLNGLFGSDLITLRLTTSGLLAGLLLIGVLGSAAFRHNRTAILAGLTIGLGIVSLWVVTGGSWGQSWIAETQSLNQPPAGVGVQSFTFVNPLGETLVYLKQLGNPLLLTLGVISVVGVTAGSLFHALFSRQWRWEWFASTDDFVRHMCGAILMGIGGMLALGCTIGQGISGVATLALGSFITLGAIIFACATTLKVQYYKLLYEQASWYDALVSSWVDWHILPQTWRRLDAL